MRRGARFAVLGVALGLLGCGDDTPARTDLPYELYCNIANGGCQARIYDSVAATLGAEGLDRPRIRTISVAQHAQEARDGFNLNDLTGDDPVSRGLRLMGFIPADSVSVAETQSDYWINEIAAYYQQSSHSITVIDREYDEVDAQLILAHEFVHAIQHRQFDLGTVGGDADSEDAILGVRGVVEGDAMHSSFAWAYEKLGYLPEEIDWDELHDDLKQGSRDDAADVEVALTDTAASFPYSYGFDYMSAATLQGGLSGRAAAFESPPGTTVQYMAGFGRLVPDVDFPEAAHPSPLGGHSDELRDRVGAWYVYGFLRRRGVSHAASWAVALNWVGDELAIYQSESEVVAVWRVRFEQNSDAVYLTDGVNEDALGVSWTALQQDNETFVIAAESQEALLAWAEQPLDQMTSALVSKSSRGPSGISAGNCTKSLDFHLPNPPPLLP